MRGRPIRFLTVMLGGWLAVRTTLLWPEPPRDPTPNDDFLPYALARSEARPRWPATHDSMLPLALAREIVPPANVQLAKVTVRRTVRRPSPGPTLMSDARILALFGLRHYVELPAPVPSAHFAAPVQSPAPAPAIGALPHTLPSRWRLSGWLMVRPGGGDPRLVPLLGGSQAGARLSYAIDERRRLAVYARVSAPLGQAGREAAAGVEWRARQVPLAAYVELRGLEGRGIAPAVGLYGGGVQDLGAFRLDTYGQAGFVGGRTASGFAEGQVRATRRIGPDVEIGAGLWGAAQRGAARLDVGPTLGLELPLGRGTRLTLDWRQRIAGEARPDSGPAISLGTDF